jgi:hypothetical protein
MRTKPKTDTKWRTKLNFSRSDMKTKTQEREIKGRRKNPIADKPPSALEHASL